MYFWSYIVAQSVLLFLTCVSLCVSAAAACSVGAQQSCSSRTAVSTLPVQKRESQVGSKLAIGWADSAARIFLFFGSSSIFATNHPDLVRVYNMAKSQRSCLSRAVVRIQIVHRGISSTIYLRSAASRSGQFSPDSRIDDTSILSSSLTLWRLVYQGDYFVIIAQSGNS